MPANQLETLIDRYDCFLLDAYGVFWASGAVGMLPGAAHAMAHLVARGKQVGILSNSTQLAAREQTKLAKHGVDKGTHYHFLLTSGEVTRDLLHEEALPFSTPRKRFHLFGDAHPSLMSYQAVFEGTGYEEALDPKEADFIYIHVPHIDGEDQEHAAGFAADVEKAAALQLPVLCANPDRYAHEGSPPRPVVRQGMIAHLLREAGAQVHCIGKPYAPAFEKALERFAAPKERVLMIGDTPETDIRGARALGLAAALVTETGIMADRLGARDLDAVIAELPEGDRPTHTIPKLALECGSR